MDRIEQKQTPPIGGFDLFWSRYPTKFNRAHAQAIWDDIDPTPAQQEAFLGALTIEAGDRERARRAGRQLPTQTGALWLIEHRHLGVEQSGSSLLQPMRVAAAWLRTKWSELRCGGSVRHANYVHASTSTRDATSRSGVSEVDGCERGIFVCTRGGVACETCPRFQAHRKLLTTWNDRQYEREPIHVGPRPPDLVDRHGEAAQVDHFDACGDAVRERAVDRSHPQPDTIGAPVAPCVQDTEHGTDHCDGERGGLDVGGVHRPGILSVAARYRRHCVLPERASTARRRIEHAGKAAFMVAFPITLAAMALQGWTAP